MNSDIDLTIDRHFADYKYREEVHSKDKKNILNPKNEVHKTYYKTSATLYTGTNTLSSTIDMSFTIINNNSYNINTYTLVDTEGSTWYNRYNNFTSSTYYVPNISSLILQTKHNPKDDLIDISDLSTYYTRALCNIYEERKKIHHENLDCYVEDRAWSKLLDCFNDLIDDKEHYFGETVGLL